MDNEYREYRDGLTPIWLDDNTPEPVYPEDDPAFWRKDEIVEQDREKAARHLLFGKRIKEEIVEQDFTGSISGFDFPPHMDIEGQRWYQQNPHPQNEVEIRPAFQFIEEGDTAFDPSILASTLDFAGAPRPKWSPEDGDDDREEENIRRRERDEV